LTRVSRPPPVSFSPPNAPPLSAFPRCRYSRWHAAVAAPTADIMILRSAVGSGRSPGQAVAPGVLSATALPPASRTGIRYRIGGEGSPSARVPQSLARLLARIRWARQSCPAVPGRTLCSPQSTCRHSRLSGSPPPSPPVNESARPPGDQADLIQSRLPNHVDLAIFTCPSHEQGSFSLSRLVRGLRNEQYHD